MNKKRTKLIISLRFSLFTLLFKSININHVFLVFNSVRSVGSPYCTTEEDYCQANAECHENGGASACQCKAGFELDGELCAGNDKISYQNFFIALRFSFFIYICIRLVSVS